MEGEGPTWPPLVPLHVGGETRSGCRSQTAQQKSTTENLQEFRKHLDENMKHEIKLHRGEGRGQRSYMRTELDSTRAHLMGRSL